MIKPKVFKSIPRIISPITHNPLPTTSISRRRSQVILEVVAAIIVLMALLIGTTKVFVHLTSNLAKRSAAFEKTRTIGVLTKKVANCRAYGANDKADHWLSSFRCWGGDVGGTETDLLSGIDPSDNGEGGIAFGFFAIELNSMETRNPKDYEQFMQSAGSCSCYWHCDWPGCGGESTHTACDSSDSKWKTNANWRLVYCTFGPSTIYMPRTAGIMPTDVQQFDYVADKVDIVP